MSLEENAGQNYKKETGKNYLKFYDRIQTTLFHTERKKGCVCWRIGAEKNVWA